MRRSLGVVLKRVATHTLELREMSMATAKDTARIWINEGRASGMIHAERPDQFLWNWPLLIACGTETDHCQSRAVWEGVIRFTTGNGLSPGSDIRIQRQHGREEEPWVDARIEASQAEENGSFCIEASFDV